MRLLLQERVQKPAEFLEVRRELQHGTLRTKEWFDRHFEGVDSARGNPRKQVPEEYHRYISTLTEWDLSEVRVDSSIGENGEPRSLAVFLRKFRPVVKESG